MNFEKRKLKNNAIFKHITHVLFSKFKNITNKCVLNKSYNWVKKDIDET